MTRGTFCGAASAVIAAGALWLAGAAQAKDMVYWSQLGGGGSITQTFLDGSGSAGPFNPAGASLAGSAGLAIDPSAGRIYWASNAEHRIYSASLDGADGTDLPITGATVNSPAGLAIDPVAGRIYWASFYGDKISSANLDGSDAMDLDTDGAEVDKPAGVALDVATGRIYWVNYHVGISYANTDGSGGGGDLPIAGATPPNRGQGLAIDPVSRRVFWGNSGNYKISFARLDGTGGGDLNLTGATLPRPSGLAIDPDERRIYWVNTGDWGDGVAVSSAALNNTGGGANLDTGEVSVSDGAFPAILRKPKQSSGRAPTIQGSRAKGAELTCDPGLWEPDVLEGYFYREPEGFARQWSRNGTAIPGADGDTLVANQPGTYRCGVGAYNHAGVTEATSPGHAVGEMKLGKVKRNRKKGTAKLAVSVPDAGSLKLRGKKVKSASRKASGAGTVKLAVKAKGKAKKKLASARRGKKVAQRVKVKVTYQPDDGDAERKVKKIKLVRRG